MSVAKPIVLLTGATGFIGAHVLKNLLHASLYRIVTPVRSPSKSVYLKERYASQLQFQLLNLVTVPDLAAPRALDDLLQQF